MITDEDLIKWGWPEDVWFHVDKVSSAHVYLRLQPVCMHIATNSFVRKHLNSSLQHSTGPDNRRHSISGHRGCRPVSEGQQHQRQ